MSAETETETEAGGEGVKGVKGVLSPEDGALVLRGSAQKLFGPWPL